MFSEWTFFWICSLLQHCLQTVNRFKFSFENILLNVDDSFWAPKVSYCIFFSEKVSFISIESFVGHISQFQPVNLLQLFYEAHRVFSFSNLISTVHFSSYFKVLIPISDLLICPLLSLNVMDASGIFLTVEKKVIEPWS